MSLYIISRYNTGVQDSVQAASDLLEAKLETLDATVNTVVARDILMLQRDRQACIGWMLFQGFDILGGAHAHVADNIDLAQHFLMPAAGDHAHAADSLTITTNP